MNVNLIIFISHPNCFKLFHRFKIQALPGNYGKIIQEVLMSLLSFNSSLLFNMSLTGLILIILSYQVYHQPVVVAHVISNYQYYIVALGINCSSAEII